VAFFESKALRLAVSSLSFAAAAALIILLTHGFERTLSIDPGSVLHESGLAYEIPSPATPWLIAYSDGPAHEQRSTVRLFENGKPLGPAHALHDLIRTNGTGAFSHWNDWVIFSTSDNSDPRKNGRHYSLSANLELNRLCWWLSAGIVLLLILSAAIWLGVVGKKTYWTLEGGGMGCLAASQAVELNIPAVLRVAGLTLVYSVALFLISTSLAVQRSSSGNLKIDFEYKVF